VSHGRVNGTGARPRVMVIARGFPNRVTAGNMTYVDAILSFLEQQDLDLRIVVLGDRFPNDEFVYRHADARRRLRYLSFRQGVRVGNGLVLTGVRPLLKNVARRTVLALPPKLTTAVKAWYFTTRQVSTEDWFVPLDPDDLAHAVQQIRSFAPHHLLIDSFMLADIVEACRDVNCTTHLIMHDLVSARLSSQGRVADSMPDYHAATLAEKTARMDEIEREELRRLALFDSILAIQRAEASFVSAKLPDKRVMYVPMPAHTRSRAEPSAALSRRCLFVGSSGHSNIQGIQWFLDAVWPLVLQQIPDAVFDICGTVCGFLSAPNRSVRLHGRVASLQPYYEMADVCVVPLLTGSGMKIKFVEALSQGSACVTTTAGMQGLEEGAGSSFLHADSADDFAKAVALLMTDQASRDRLRRRGAAFVEEHLSAAAVFEELRRAVVASSHQAY
jgi:glycosyltransferase involved in cell wall biosynthesis